MPPPTHWYDYQAGKNESSDDNILSQCSIDEFFNGLQQRVHSELILNIDYDGHVNDANPRAKTPVNERVPRIVGQDTYLAKNICSSGGQCTNKCYPNTYNVLEDVLRETDSIQKVSKCASNASPRNAFRMADLDQNNTDIVKKDPEITTANTLTRKTDSVNGNVHNVQQELDRWTPSSYSALFDVTNRQTYSVQSNIDKVEQSSDEISPSVYYSFLDVQRQKDVGQNNTDYIKMESEESTLNSFNAIPDELRQTDLVLNIASNVKEEIQKITSTTCNVLCDPLKQTYVVQSNTDHVKQDPDQSTPNTYDAVSQTYLVQSHEGQVKQKSEICNQSTYTCTILSIQNNVYQNKQDLDKSTSNTFNALCEAPKQTCVGQNNTYHVNQDVHKSTLSTYSTLRDSQRQTTVNTDTINHELGERISSTCNSLPFSQRQTCSVQSDTDHDQQELDKRTSNACGSLHDSLRQTDSFQNDKDHAKQESNMSPANINEALRRTESIQNNIEHDLNRTTSKSLFALHEALGHSSSIINIANPAKQDLLRNACNVLLGDLRRTDTDRNIEYHLNQNIDGSTSTSYIAPYDAPRRIVPGFDHGIHASGLGHKSSFLNITNPATHDLHKTTPNVFHGGLRRTYPFQNIPYNFKENLNICTGTVNSYIVPRDLSTQMGSIHTSIDHVIQDSVKSIPNDALAPTSSAQGFSTDVKPNSVENFAHDVHALSNTTRQTHLDRNVMNHVPSNTCTLKQTGLIYVSSDVDRQYTDNSRSEGLLQTMTSHASKIDPKRPQSSDSERLSEDVICNNEDTKSLDHRPGDLRRMMKVDTLSSQEPCIESDKVTDAGVKIAEEKARSNADDQELVNEQGDRREEPGPVKRHECDLCPFASDIESRLQTHQRVHTGEKMFKCKVCDRYFNRKDNLERHLKIHLKTHNCDICARVCTTKAELSIHKRTHRDKLFNRKYTSRKKARLDIHKKINFEGPELYTCNVCQNVYKQRHGLILHTMTHTGVKPYLCDVCGYACKTKSTLKIHQRIHAIERPFKCTLCKYVAVAKVSLKYHIMNVHSMNKYTCVVCERSFKNKMYLSSHMKSHSEENLCKCDICGKHLPKKGFKGHMRTHFAVKMFTCNYCEYASSKHSLLKRHMTVHTGEKPFKCDVCKFAANVKNVLDLHMRVHTGEKPFKCDTCNYACRRKQALVIHMRIHTGEKPFKCDVCVYRCSSRILLSKHKKIHTGDKPYKCDVCDFASIQKTVLDKHKRTHTGEKPYTCSVCSYSAIQKSLLDSHMRKHTGEKPYKCDICEYASYQKGQLDSHIMRKHTGEKPYVCDVCGHACYDKGQLRSHLKKHA